MAYGPRNIGGRGRAVRNISVERFANRPFPPDVVTNQKGLTRKRNVQECLVFLVNAERMTACWRHGANLGMQTVAAKHSNAYRRELSTLDVLVVDDNFHMRRLVHTILEAFDVKTIREATDGTEALAEIKIRQPDLIISDWEMKPMDGCSFLEVLRRADNKPACFIPVIMLTAHGRPRLIRQAFEAGASQFLVKPLTPANLLHRVDWILGDKRPFFEDEGQMRQQLTLKLPKAAVAVAEQKVAAGDAWDLDL
ncbi:MAG: hypothetical protein CMI60_14935 [Parvibaculum sp.]|nr:hypothetical protein [Parvibaculum sp.]